MTEAASRAEVEAAKAYQDFFVPALFQEWAPRVVGAARVGSGDRVLDVACGTGVLAREAAARVGAEGSVTGLDPAPGMLTVAARLAPGIDWRQGTAESLPFPGGSFEAVVSQFGLMFFEDRRTALEEMKRVLAPGGRVAVAVWDSLENTPAYADDVELLESMAGSRAADALRAPFVLGDRDRLVAMFEQAGYPAPEVIRQVGKARFPSIRAMVEADLRGWLPVMGVNLSEEVIEEILEAAEERLSSYRTPEGSVEFDSPALVAVASDWPRK